MQSVLFVKIAATAELKNGAAAGIADLDREFDLRPVGLHVIDDHPFAEGTVADVDFLDVELVEEVGDEQGAGGDLIGAAGIEAREMAALVQGHAEKAFVDRLKIIPGHVGEEAVADGFLTMLEDAHGGEVFHGAGGADHALRAQGTDVFDGGLQGFADVFFEGVKIAAGDGIGMDELLGEAGSAELEGFEEQRLGVGADDEFA